VTILRGFNTTMETNMPTHPEPVPAPPHRTVGGHSVRSLVAGAVGSAIEMFDWMIYTTFAIYFSEQFFTGGKTAALLSTFAVFAIGFIMRPLGGWVFGMFADRIGRRTVCVVTIAGIGGSSLIISILPTYSSIGIFAPILMTLLRMVQGFSFGGNYTGVTLFLAESAPPRRRGFYSSFQFSSSAVGMLVSSALAWTMTHYMSRGTLEAWGWRIPFAIGGCAGLATLWLRRHIAETSAFEKLQRQGAHQRRSLWYIWTHYPKLTLRFLGMIVLGAFGFYLFTSFLPVYAIHSAKAAPSDAFMAATITLIIFMVSQPLFGALSDRFGRRPQLIVFALGYLVLLYPAMMSVSANFWMILLIDCFGMLLYGLYSAIAPAIMVELFPTEVRSIGIGATYNLVVALLGGTAPYLMAAATAHGLTGWFLGYVCCFALFGLITYWKMPETAGIDLQ
jgi:MHS family alpha-ketoglutarate permease-like MFS transporter